MAASVPSHPYTIRPAISSDRRQLQALLQSFLREQTISFIDPMPFLGWVILGIITALGLHVLLSPVSAMAIGVRVLVGVGAIVGVGTVGTFWQFTEVEDWSQFWVVEYQGRLIGCAKLCRYRNYSTLYNVLIAASWRRQGVGTNLVQRVAQAASKPLYLACRPDRIPSTTVWALNKFQHIP
jgi:hypothetical protein